MTTSPPPDDLLARLQGMTPAGAAPSEPVDLLAALTADRPSPRRRRDEDEEELDETAKGFRERARREAERYLAATDSEYWFAVCFWTEAARDAVLSALNVDAIDGRWVDGYRLAAELGITITADEAEPVAELDPLAQLQALAAPGGGLSAEDVLAALNAEPVPDPLASVSYTGDLAVDARAELDTLADAFRAAKARRDRPRQITDSWLWFGVVFRLRADKDCFLQRAGLTHLGDKYLDGHGLATTLDIPLPGTEHGKEVNSDA
ncbi:hypothetical protein NLX83_13810 [Allokutzneria sp. A3M-2-11 16]|uniref:hypothetical protein n=1 Tax=Allokutzneria sp. A3M-2-11 16 TaxID=2962043 RepID=UPI0020B6F708|nr:hypothetical protein [Allokutzneria sp. A3M-2-11 16]MCP3800335.1 hypothetical protein [Allokutzneria sp. A3M-2-11 16]